MSVPTETEPRDPAAKRERAPDAVLLAAGRGVRLRPLTDSLPKVLVPICGRPLLDFHLQALSRAGIERVVLIVGYRGDEVRTFVGDGSRFGLEAHFVEQSPPRGTGDALRVAREEVRTDQVLICYGDVFLLDELEVLRRLLSDREPKIVAASVPDGGGLGRLLTAERAGRTVLVGLREKDGQRTPGLVNAGVYLLPRRIFNLVDRVPLSPRGEIELTDAVLAYALQVGAVRVVPAGGWFDIGDLKSLANAEALVTSNRSEAVGAGSSGKPA
jgi:UDP-N-acetylglucosamine diphosphorylase / glucose-1-phosphate thymidylyltransferase / UDP-N-acetylgalactosamine diphosphorylase / glucosamine-1-phosphate N-acetyltransferase / galactosamine-1-phosphate N-acetyltransferase